MFGAIVRGGAENGFLHLVWMECGGIACEITRRNKIRDFRKLYTGLLVVFVCVAINGRRASSTK